MIKTMEGVRVLEVAAWTYVPAAGAVLAEWGADVIKVEHPETGDPQRGLVNSGLIPTGPGGVSHIFELPNRGKRSVGIDLKTPEGREVLMELVAQSDVFLTNFLPQPRASLRIEVDDIRAVNPDIIYARGSGQGQEGPERDKGGFDGSAFWGRVVADIATPGDRDRPVSPPGPAFGDMLGGLVIAGGISAALYHRERTGEALVVDNSLMGTAMWATSGTLMAASLFGFDALPKGTRFDVPNPLVGDYRTKDGRFITLMMLQADRMWPDLLPKIGHPELMEDPRFRTPEDRRANRRECIEALDEIFATRTLEEWKVALQDGEGVWAPVSHPGEVMRDPQALANGYVVDVESQAGTTFQMVPSPLQFDQQVPELTRAPDHGEHTDEVLAQLGKSEEEIIELKISGAVL
jgi:crotonobetainyl-CoA:carnitine CoA-transferase CaiB-like acyl-CoA transferase